MYFASANKRKGLFFVIFSMVLFFGGTQAQTQDLMDSQETTGSVSCGDMSFSVGGNFYVKTNQKAVYTIDTTSILDTQARIEYELWEKNTLQTTYTDGDFVYTFTQPGTYILKTILRRSATCIAAKEQTIIVADTIWLGIGIGQQQIDAITLYTKDTGIAFVSVQEVENNDAEAIRDRVQQIAHVLPQSSLVFVKDSQARALFDHIDDMRTRGIGFPERIILVGEITTNAVKRYVAQFPSITDFSEIVLVPRAYISSVMQQISTQQPLDELQVVTIIHPKETMYRRRMPVSAMTDYLITQGMPLDILLFLLYIPVIVLCLVIAKQMLGYAIGNMYYVLLVAMTFILLGEKTTSILLLATACGYLLTQLFAQKIYILYASKIGLIVVLSCLSFVALYTLFLVVGFVGQLPTHMLSLFFPLITFSLMMHYLLPQTSAIKKKGWWIEMFQFLGGVIGVILLVKRTGAQEFVFGYPDSILLVVVLIIFVGRFSGLQLSEYIRFWPLVKKQLFAKKTQGNLTLEQRKTILKN